jgi:membrane protease YdiL (CAAX protease family)
MNIYKKISTINKDSGLLVSSLIILSCLFLSITFPVNKESLGQLLTKNIFFLVIIPALYIKLILKKDLASFGLNIKNKKAGIFWGMFFLIALFLLYYLLLAYTNLPKKYLLPSNVTSQFYFFLIYELVLMNIMIFAYEFFYRGFVLFLFSKKIGHWAIFLQAIIFVLFSSVENGFYWQFAAPLVLSLSSGILAYKSKSFIFSYISNLLFIIILNSYIIYTVK